MLHQYDQQNWIYCVCRFEKLGSDSSNLQIKCEFLTQGVKKLSKNFRHSREIWYFVQNKAHPYIGWPIRWSCWPCWDDPRQITRVEASLSSKFSFSGLTWNMMFYVCSRLEVLWAWWDGPDHSAVMNPCCPGLSVLLPITLTSVPVLLLIMVLQIW